METNNMDIEPFTINLTCLFCDSVLTGDENAEYESGDMIKCEACGETNDYDSVLEVAREKGIAEMEKKVEKGRKRTLQPIQIKINKNIDQNHKQIN